MNTVLFSNVLNRWSIHQSFPDPLSTLRMSKFLILLRSLPLVSAPFFIIQPLAIVQAVSTFEYSNVELFLLFSMFVQISSSTIHNLATQWSIYRFMTIVINARVKCRIFSNIHTSLHLILNHPFTFKCLHQKSEDLMLHWSPFIHDSCNESHDVHVDTWLMNSLTSRDNEAFTSV